MFFFLLDRISSYHRQTQTSSPHCTRRCNWEQQQSQGSCHSERVQDLLLASWAPKTQTKYNSNIRKRYQIHIWLLMIRQCLFYPTWPMRKKESTGKLNFARFVLSAFPPEINGKKFGNDDHVSRMINYQKINRLIDQSD